MAIDLEHCRQNFRQRLAQQQVERESLRQKARTAAIDSVLRVAPAYPDISQIYLFGSVTQPGRFSDRSDIDIAVVGTDASSYFSLWQDLEEVCPDWFIDLREINQPCHFANIVCQTGELIYDSSNSSNCHSSG